MIRLNERMESYGDRLARRFRVPREEPAAQGLFYRQDKSPYLRLWMKNACNVELEIEEQRYIFLEVERDIWEMTLEKEPGFYYVTLYVDGVEVLCPFLPVCYGCGRFSNYLEIAPEEDFCRINNVAHGTIRCETFFSEVTQRTENCLVYVPPGYEEGKESYPVLYLQHGYGEDETGWVRQGKISAIMDNLLEEKKAVPMLIVMANGMLTESESPEPKMPVGQFSEFLRTDLLPFVEKKYRIKADRRSRAMAGLSMGSMQTSFTAFSHPELFGWIGLFSGFMRNYSKEGADSGAHLKKLLEDPETFNRENCLLFRAMGNRDGLFTWFMQEDQLCEDYGIRQVRRIYEGGHDWNVWRRCAQEFLQMLF